MSDFAGLTPAPTPSDPAPAPDATASGAGSSDAPAVHPAWERAVAHIPEAYRGPVYEGFREADREAQAAIEKARQQATPQDWAPLLEEAKKAGLSPQDLIEAYNGRLDFMQELYSDPDKFISGLNELIDREVAAGNMTRRQAAQARQDVADAANGDDPIFESPEAKEIAELKAWRKQQEEQQTAAQQAEQARRAEEAANQQAQQVADEFMSTFDQQLIANGFRAAGANGGQSTDVLPAPLLQQIAYTADALLDANPGATAEQAITAAIKQFRDSAVALGAQLPQPGATPTLPPVIGAGGGGSAVTQLPAAQAAAPGEAKTQTQKSDDAVRVMKEMLSSGR
jgi:hypothetical protein